MNNILHYYVLCSFLKSVFHMPPACPLKTASSVEKFSPEISHVVRNISVYSNFPLSLGREVCLWELSVSFK